MRGLVGTALVVVAAAVFAPPAAAYPWTITHNYASCAACHVDPSGAGQITAYGRGMSDLLVRWHANASDFDSGEPSPTAGLLFGLLTPPDWLNLGGNVRGGGMLLDAGGKILPVPLVMALDGTATIEVGPVVAHAALGYGVRNVGPAVVVSPNAGPDNALVSREHWIGLKLFDGAMELRAGRMPLPFGLRINEHTAFVRDYTRTNGDVQQQHGVSLWFGNEVLRGEIMAIAGNYQIRPDAVRERGYSGYLEIDAVERLGFGVSSLATYATRDINTNVATFRQAHGAFVRWGALDSLAVMAEGDALLTSHDGVTDVGGAGWLTADYEPFVGIHVMPALEALYTGDGTQSLPTMGVWLSGAWYVLPHTELRLDGIYHETFPAGGTATGDVVGLVQLHFFL